MMSFGWSQGCYNLPITGCVFQEKGPGPLLSRRMEEWSGPTGRTVGVEAPEMWHGSGVTESRTRLVRAGQ